MHSVILWLSTVFFKIFWAASICLSFNQRLFSIICLSLYVNLYFFNHISSELILGFLNSLEFSKSMKSWADLFVGATGHLTSEGVSCFATSLVLPFLEKVVNPFCVPFGLPRLFATLRIFMSKTYLNHSHHHFC